MSCKVCGGSGLLLLPMGVGVMAEVYYCDCIDPADPRRLAEPRGDFATWRLGRPDWRERVRGWAERLALACPDLAGALRARAEAITGGGNGAP